MQARMGVETVLLHTKAILKAHIEAVHENELADVDAIVSTKEVKDEGNIGEVNDEKKAFVFQDMVEMRRVLEESEAAMVENCLSIEIDNLEEYKTDPDMELTDEFLSEQSILEVVPAGEAGLAGGPPFPQTAETAAEGRGSTGGAPPFQ